MPVQAGSVHVRQVFLETKATLIVVSIEIKFYTSGIMTLERNYRHYLFKDHKDCVHIILVILTY